MKHKMLLNPKREIALPIFAAPCNDICMHSEEGTDPCSNPGTCDNEFYELIPSETGCSGLDCLIGCDGSG